MNRLIIAALLITLTASCTKRIYVPVESVHTEYIDRHSIDTLLLADSIHVSERRQGDTIFIEKWRERIVYRSKATADTICLTDSVPMPYPVEVIKEVEKPANRWQRALMWAGGIALLLGGAALLRRG